MLDADLLLFRPVQQRSTDVFGPIIIANHLWLAAPFDDLFKCEDDARRKQRQVDFDG